MLGAFEQIVVNALRAPPSVADAIFGGPAPGPPTSTRIGVTARDLTCAHPLLSEPDDPPRAPGVLSRRSIVSPDSDSGDKRNFALPADALPIVAEVQSPAGTLVVQGDDFVVDGRIVRFFRDNPPAPIEVVTQGEQAAGYMERAACQVDLDLIVWAADVAIADALSGLSLERALAAFAGRTVVTAIWNAGSGFRVRLLSTRASLAGVSRDVETVAAVGWVRCTTRLRVRGELELMLASGTEDSTGVIREIVYRAV